MSAAKHYMNNEPISIHNIYKYLVNLLKIKVIPYFMVSINNTKDEITFTFNYTDIKFGKFGKSKLIYNIYTKIWTSKFNTTSFNTICKNYNYLIKANMVSIDNIVNNNIVINLQSQNIDDILEPSLNPFNTELNIDVYNMHEIDNTVIHNIYHSEYYLFMNNVIQLDNYNKFKMANLEQKLYKPIYDIVLKNYAESTVINTPTYDNFLNKYT
jgi:hypothetical protein